MSRLPGLSVFAFLSIVCVSLRAQANSTKPKPPNKTVSGQSQSNFSYAPASDGSETVEIQNVTYEYTGTGIPGRPSDQRLLLRKTVHSKASVDDVGVEATVTLEAWPLGVDLKQKPLYSLTLSGTGGRIAYPDLFIAGRGLEEFEWWSVYKLGNAQHLFDTDVPLVSFSIRRDVLTTRYAGLQVPADDTKTLA